MAPRNDHENLTLFSSISLDGMRAAMLLDGAADGASFQVYVQQVLVPTMRPRQLIIMDNLSVHKRPAIRAAIGSTGCRVLILPSYSLDFNPIELAFRTIQAHLRRVGARTKEPLEAAIAEALDLVSSHRQGPD